METIDIKNTNQKSLSIRRYQDGHRTIVIGTRLEVCGNWDEIEIDVNQNEVLALKVALRGNLSIEEIQKAVKKLVGDVGDFNIFKE